MISVRTCVAVLAVSLTMLSLDVIASIGPWQSKGPIEARLISEGGGLAGKTELLIGLNLKMKPGWKTYWRTPGAAGASPRLEFSNQEFDGDFTWHWPAPERFHLLDLQSYGYSNEVVIPITLPLNRSVESMQLEGTAHVYVCNEVCLSLSIPVALDIGHDEFDWESQRLLNRYLSRVPKIRNLLENQTQQKFVIDSGGLYLSLDLQQVEGDADVFIENANVHDWPDPTVEVSGNRVQLWWDRGSGMALEESPDKIKFTYVDKLQAFESELRVESKSRPLQTAGSGYIVIVLMAWLGGLILNVMPCVLPVLSMKLVSLSGMRTASTGSARLQLLSTVLGVLSVFWIIALVLSVLKAGGFYVGWGIQFQSPYFLIFMLLLMMLFVANLLGRFEFSLPSSLQTRLAASGGSSASSPNLTSFIQGGSATLLATPCSAPFLGTAITFALGRSWPDIFAIMTAVGIGLATPFLVMIVWPGSLTIIPKPGPWMLTLKRGLAAGMLLAAVWVVWLLSNHFSTVNLALIILLTLLWFGIWFLPDKPWRKKVWVLLTLGVFFTPQFFGSFERDSGFKAIDFDPTQIDDLLVGNSIVFVDITADWCITCKYNKVFVLNTEPIKQLFLENGVVFMQGDWSLPNTRIEKYLQKNGRSGIPFNTIYSTNYPNGLVLSELLTIEDVTDAIQKSVISN